MAQVVSNLVGNALTHGAVDAPVELALHSDGSGALLEVSNRGPAIEPELAGRLFEPFRRGNRDGDARGLGLGLYIVREIVSAHGGTIEVRSTDERTSFRVRLRA
jgi:signal transduction histidine kinase